MCAFGEVLEEKQQLVLMHWCGRPKQVCLRSAPGKRGLEVVSCKNSGFKADLRVLGLRCWFKASELIWHQSRSV